MKKSKIQKWFAYMAQEFNNNPIAIIGAGASGCICAYYLLKKGFEVTLFDKGSPLRTLLPTGGGRCNLAHAEYDFKELAHNYPRGEKFLYSIFSKFSTADTLELFEEMGIETYVQENGRIFPNSNSAKEVRETILKQISKAQILQENVIEISVIDNGFKLITEKHSSNTTEKKGKSSYFFSKVIIATGGHSGYKLAQDLGIKIINPKPSLVGLNTEESFKELSGTVIKNVKSNGITDDLLFTHFGISGPLTYTISSIKAFDKVPYELTFDLCADLDNLQDKLNTFPHKEIKNILTDFLPQKVVKLILKDFDETQKAHKIDGKTRDLILDKIHNFKINITGTNKGEETVTAGGIDLDEINPKTMEVKKIANIYAIGEVLNIDGFCGGFNLQNAWSTAYVCSSAITK